MKQGWEIKKLGDVCEKTTNIKWQENQGVEFEYIDLTAVSRDSLQITETVFINSTNAPSRAKKVTKTNDVIFATTRPTLKRITKITNQFDNQICSTGFVVLRSKKDVIEPGIVFYFLQTDMFMDRMESIQRGTSYPAVTDKDVKGTILPFPVSIEEQKRIVAKLDQCFEVVDKAKANVERNLNNAKELFQSQLNQIFSQKGEGWVEKKLGEVCVVERGSSPRPIKNYVTENEDGVNWIKIGDTKNVEKYIYSTKEKITKEGAKKSRFVDIGGFILSNSMTYGKPYIMKTQGYIHDGWFVLRLPDDINSEFFWYLLASPYTMNQFEYLAAGAIVKNISGDLVKKAMLPIPPITEQEKIVVELDNLSTQAQSLESHYRQELDALAELKKSILQKAFNGEL